MHLTRNYAKNTPKWYTYFDNVSKTLSCGIYIFATLVFKNKYIPTSSQFLHTLWKLISQVLDPSDPKCEQESLTCRMTQLYQFN